MYSFRRSLSYFLLLPVGFDLVEVDHGGRLSAMGGVRPLHRLVEAHVLAAERLHGDDTTVPILAKGKTDTGRIWTYVRDDRPFGGRSPPAALYYASRDRRQEHPERHLKTFTGILQADAYGGYNPLFKAGRVPAPLIQALCWAHARRKFFVLADIAANARHGKKAAPISPIALEAVKRIDALFDIEREINGLAADDRLDDAVRTAGRSSPSFRNGCGPSGPACRAALRSPRRSITC